MCAVNEKEMICKGAASLDFNLKLYSVVEPRQKAGKCSADTIFE
jgi:hypothetical protein